MVTVDIKKDTNELVEELQDQLPWSATKKEIIAESVEQFYKNQVDVDKEDT